MGSLVQKLSHLEKEVFTADWSKYSEGECGVHSLDSWEMETLGELSALAEEFEKLAKCFDVPALIH